MRARMPWLLVPMLLLAAGEASARHGQGTGTIKGTPHDFSARAPNAPGGVGLCTFCHTPHRAIETRLLWNHTLSQNTYTWQDIDRTIGGTLLPTITQSWIGPTKYCLSCHDGSVAFGDVNWWLGGKPVTPLNIGRFSATSRNLVGSGGNMSGTHPVGVPYPYQNATNAYNGVTTGDDVIISEFEADPTTHNIRLFNNPSGTLVVAGAAAGKTGMECSSCHDPHGGSTVEDDYFVRGKLRGDSLPYLCLKCHSKD